MTLGTQVMFASLEVKGEATLASVSEREIPAWAAFNAWGENEENNITVVLRVITDLLHNHWLHHHT